MSEINRLKRRRANLGYYSGPVPPVVPDPTEWEWDRRRQYLAEELLKILSEDASWDTGDIATGVTAENLTGLAKAAMSAAEVIYPEVEHVLIPASTLADVPAATQFGAATVMPTGD